VIAASGLKYVGIDTTTLGWLLCGMLLLSASLWLAIARPWHRSVAPVGGVSGVAQSPEDALAVEETISTDR
jgi:hypothetical protein